MIWLRTLAYLMPLLLGFAGVLLVREVARLELPRPGDALVTAVQKPIGPLSALGAVDGVTREIRDLVFDPLLRRDQNFELQPHLLESWRFRTVLTVYCASEEDAGEVEALINSSEYRPGAGLEIAQCVREGENLTLMFPGFARQVEEEFLDQIDRDRLANFQVVNLIADHSVETLLESFLTTSIEKKRIRMFDIASDEVAVLFLDGDISPLLEELEPYLDSNSGLNPRVEQDEYRSHVLAREAIFQFRDDIFWHDGEKFTVEDVLFSIEKFTGEDSSSPLTGLFWFAESIEGRGDSEIRFLCHSLPAMGYILECWEKLCVVPEHLFMGRNFSEAWDSYLGHPVGTGPYRVDERFRDGGIKLSANESYLPGRPQQEELIYRRFDSLESKLLALRSFRVDCLVPDDRFLLWSQRNAGEVERMKSVPRFQHFLVWNLGREPFSQQDFRLAMAEAVDPGAWVGESSDSFLEPIRGLFHAGVLFDPGPITLPVYDVANAANRLEELGYTFDESRGIRKKPNGKPLEITLSVNRESDHQRRLADSLAEQWQRLGIQVTIEELPIASILMDRLVPREFGAVLLSWEIPKGRDRFQAFHSRSGGKMGTNLFDLDDRDVDRMIESLRIATDPEEVKRIAGELQERIADLQPCLFLAESGRVLWFRQDGVEVVPPDGWNEIGSDSFISGAEGVTWSRPWWVKVGEPDRNDSGEGR